MIFLSASRSLIRSAVGLDYHIDSITDTSNTQDPQLCLWQTRWINALQQTVQQFNVCWASVQRYFCHLPPQ